MKKKETDVLLKGIITLASILIWVFVLPIGIESLLVGSTIWFISLLLFLLFVFFHETLLGLFGLSTNELLPIKIWRPQAVLELKQNHDVDWSKFSFEAESFEHESTPFGIIWVENKFNKELRGAFVDIRKNSPNLVVSKLENKDWHLRSKKVDSLQECAEVYLKGAFKEHKNNPESFNHFVDDKKTEVLST